MERSGLQAIHGFNLHLMMMNELIKAPGGVFGCSSWYHIIQRPFISHHCL